MISFEKIDFCALMSKWITLNVARSKDFDNFWLGGIRSFHSSTYTLYELTLEPSSARFGHGIPEFSLTTNALVSLAKWLCVCKGTKWLRVPPLQ